MSAAETNLDQLACVKKALVALSMSNILDADMSNLNMEVLVAFGNNISMRFLSRANGKIYSFDNDRFVWSESDGSYMLTDKITGHPLLDGTDAKGAFIL